MAFKEWPLEIQTVALQIASDWALAEVGPTLDKCSQAPDIVDKGSNRIESVFLRDLRVAFAQALTTLELELGKFIEPEE